MARSCCNGTGAAPPSSSRSSSRPSSRSLARSTSSTCCCPAGCAPCRAPRRACTSLLARRCARPVIGKRARVSRGSSAGTGGRRAGRTVIVSCVLPTCERRKESQYRAAARAKRGRERGTHRRDEPPEVLWRAPQVGQERVRKVRRDEVVAQPALDDAHHLLCEPRCREGRGEELVVRVLHGVAHLRRDLGRADDRGAHARGVVAVWTRGWARGRRELGRPSESERGRTHRCLSSPASVSWSARTAALLHEYSPAHARERQHRLRWKEQARKRERERRTELRDGGVRGRGGGLCARG